MRRVLFALIALGLWLGSAPARAAGLPYGTWAKTVARVGGKWSANEGDHWAEASYETEHGYASAVARAYLYDLGAHGYAYSGGQTDASTYGTWGSFWDAYTVQAAEGAEQVQVGLRVRLSGSVGGEGGDFEAGFGLAVHLNDEIEPFYTAYVALDEAGASASSTGGTLGVDDLQPIQDGYELSGFEEVYYFWVDPGTFSLVFYLDAWGKVGSYVSPAEGWAQGSALDTAQVWVFPADPNITAFGSASGQLGPVPLPGSLLLLGSGLLGLAGLRRRQAA